MNRDIFASNGISMIESLSVIALIALLLIAGLTQYVRQLPKARDGRRKADLQELKVGFEDYYNDNQCYPPVCALSDCTEVLRGYVQANIPLDPKNKTPYVYIPYPNSSGPTCGGYRVLVALEKEEDSDISRLGCESGCGGVPAEVVPDGMTAVQYNYGIFEGVTIKQ